MILTLIRMNLNLIWLVYAHLFRTDFTATKLRQYDVDEFDFHIYDTTFNWLSNDGTLKDLRSKVHTRVISNIHVDTFL